MGEGGLPLDVLRAGLLQQSQGATYGLGHSSPGQGSTRASEPPKFNVHLPSEMTQYLQVFQERNT